jgi:hypothetical protein
MKKATVICLLLLLGAALSAALSAQSAPNHQKIYPIDSEVYQAVKALYISRGLALPSTTGPWSEDELLLMLDRIEPENLRAGERAAWDYAEHELSQPTKVFKFNGSVNLEGYAHTNTYDFLTEDRYVRLWNQSKPFIDLNFESWISRNFYGMGDISVGIWPYNATTPEHDTTTVNPAERVSSTIFAQAPVSTNFPLFDIYSLDFNIPYRAFLAAGGAGWSLAAGRERLSWGPGESGNFMVGSQVHYHTGARLALYGGIFKYTFNVSGFPHPIEYYNRKFDAAKDTETSVVVGNEEGGVHNPVVSMRDSVKGIYLFIAHRFEWRIINKINFVMSESIMYQSEDGSIQLDVLGPTALLHNLYRTGNSNSLVTVEIDYSPVHALNVYGQAAMDEFQGPNESAAVPNRFGFMLGAKTALSLGGGMLTSSLEWAYTDPYLYLRGVDGQTQAYGIKRYPLSYIVANRYYVKETFAVENFLGYRWGGDAIVINANAFYRVFGKWNAGANLMVMVHGTHDLWTYSSNINRPGFPDNYATPTPNHDNLGNALGDVSGRNAPYVMTALSLSGSWSVLRGLSLYGQTDFVWLANKGNVKGESAFDLQLTLGAGYSL